MNRHKLYLAVVGIVFVAIMTVFDFFPRSTESELEKRRLAEFPELTAEALWSGRWTADVSAWFSDTEPFRDQIMEMSMKLRRAQGLPKDEESVTVHVSSMTAEEEETDTVEVDESLPVDTVIPLDIDAKIKNNGIIVVGAVPTARALMAFGGGSKGGISFAKAANRYQATFAGQAQVYTMIVPTSIEFYCPEKVQNITRPQLPVIEHSNSLLDETVKPVVVYDILKAHAGEDIYLRTDHHWAPLGAFYAAREFARVAGVPFRDLDGYEQHTIHDFVGSMYGYSEDITVKQSPEDFRYYTPAEVSYAATIVDYENNGQNITRERRPRKGDFFLSYKDGSGNAYLTFMGGDMKHVRVTTGTGNGRRLLIIKDSFGNALPGYMFYSFEEVHVADFRYFTRNLVQYVSDNKITDILLVLNVFNAYSGTTGQRLERLLTRTNLSNQPLPDTTLPADTVKTDTVEVAAAVVADTLGTVVADTIINKE